jgi:hypothetical protein
VASQGVAVSSSQLLRTNHVSASKHFRKQRGNGPFQRFDYLAHERYFSEQTIVTAAAQSHMLRCMCESQITLNALA